VVNNSWLSVSLGLTQIAHGICLFQIILGWVWKVHHLGFSKAFPGNFTITFHLYFCPPYFSQFLRILFNKFPEYKPTQSLFLGLNICYGLHMKHPLPRGSCVDSFVSSWWSYWGWLDHKGANLINGLIHWWVHSWTGYWEAGPSWKKRVTRNVPSKVVFFPGHTHTFSLSLP
jgi:hypothetical protein